MSNRNQEIVVAEAQTNGVEPEVTIFNKAIKHVTLKFQDVTYKVKIERGDQGGFFRKKMINTEEKLILKGFSGTVRPGETLAMLGPSGSGKTTLLTALGGRLRQHSLTGTITYNGKPFSSSLNRNTGFVTQQDILYPHLTVTETLVFTALLRLPNTYSKQDKIMQAEAVITQLGLTKCKNTMIGGPAVSFRGVSGGERKRVSIGQELLINPSLLLVDEPTSGLDSTTAQMIVSKLWELARNGGRTVVMTIHQPSGRLFYMFHKVLLLSEGSPLYFGLGAEVMQYFAGIGYAPSVPMNPADFLLDLSNGISPDDTQKDKSMVKASLVSAYKMHIEDKVKEESTDDQIDDGVNIADDTKDKHLGRWATTWWQQLTTLMRRGVKERKHAVLSPSKIAQVVAIAFMVGLLWWQSGSGHLQEKMGLLFFYSSFWGMYPVMQAIFTFPKERKMLEKERSSRMYRLSSYFMSRVIGDLPLELILPTTFLVITYWMAGLKPSLPHFIHTLAVLLFSVLVAQGLGLAIGALIMQERAAITLGSVLMMSFALSAGYFVQDVPPFIAWIRYLSVSHHTYKLLLGSQYKVDDTYPCDDGHGRTCLVGEFLAIKKVGLDGQVVSAIGLLVMVVGYRLVAYIALTRFGMPKRWCNL